MLFAFLSASDFTQNLATCIPFVFSTILVMESTAIPGVFVAILDLPLTLENRLCLMSSLRTTFSLPSGWLAVVLLPKETPTLPKTIRMLHPLF